MKKWFENLKISRKLMTAFFLIIFLYAVTVCSALLSINSMSRRMKDLNDKQYTNVQSSLGMIAGLQAVGRNLAVLSSTDGMVDEDEYLKNTRSLIAEEEAAYEVLVSGYVVDSDKIEELRQEFEKLKEPRERILSRLETGADDDALTIYLKEYEPQAEKVRTILNEVVKLCETDSQESLDSAQTLNIRVVVMLLILSACCIGLTVVICAVIVKSITGPVRQIKSAANAIARGQLSLTLNYSSENELGQLADDIRSTAEALKQYVSEVREGLSALGHGRLNYSTKVEFRGDFVALGDAMEEIGRLLRDSLQQIGSSAEQVSAGAEQVSNGAQGLAQGASEQAGSIEELAVSINEIAESVKENADGAVESSRVADEVGRSLLDCDGQMQLLTENIQQIGHNSHEITGIVKEIEDIAFQTNILALNASVEAARAGEAGRGFSVVAGEIRHLAAKTSEASRLTAELIDNNTQAVKEGMSAVDVTAGTLQKSVKGAQDVTKRVDQISRMSIQQADAIAQIRRSVELISEIVQGNSATSEESAAASEELSAQAQILKELVERFEF